MSAADTKLLLEKGEDNTDGDSSGLDSDAKTSGDAFNTSPPDDEGTRRLKPAKELKKIVYAVTLSRSEQDRCSRIQRLKELLEEPDLVNHRYKKDETPLHLLCRRVADIKDDNFQPCIDSTSVYIRDPSHGVGFVEVCLVIVLYCCSGRENGRGSS